MFNFRGINYYRCTISIIIAHLIFQLRIEIFSKKIMFSLMCFVPWHKAIIIFADSNNYVDSNIYVNIVTLIIWCIYVLYSKLFCLGMKHSWKIIHEIIEIFTHKMDLLHV